MIVDGVELTLKEWLEEGGREENDIILDIEVPIKRTSVSRERFEQQHRLQEGLGKISDTDLMQV